MDWKNDIAVGEYIVIECYRKLDPTTFTDVNDDLFLKIFNLLSLLLVIIIFLFSGFEK